MVDDEHAFTLTVLIAGVLGFVESFAQSTLFSIAAQLPDGATGAIMNGQGISGVAVAFCRIVTKAAMPDTAEGLLRSSIVYFALAALVEVLAIFSYYVLVRLPYARAFLERNKTVELPPLDDAAAQADGAGADGDADDTRSSLTERPLLIESARQYTVEPDLSVAIVAAADGDDEQVDVDMEETFDDDDDDDKELIVADDIDDNVDDDNDENGNDATAKAHVSMRTVMWNLRVPCALIACTFIATLSVFPGVIASALTSESLGSWMPVALVAVFSVCDAVGRFVPKFDWAIDWITQRMAIVAVALRFAFVPLLVLLALEKLVPLSLSEIAAFVLTALLALSNGYCSTVIMMRALQWANVTDPLQLEFGGIVLAFSLVTGLTCGAFIGFLFDIVIL
jgi:Nucleoside transporter